MTYEERRQRYIIKATELVDTPEIRAEAERKFEMENGISDKKTASG